MNLDVGVGGGFFATVQRAEITLDLDIPKILPSFFIRADAHHLPFSSKQFDTVYCSNVLEHVKNPWQCISELKRVGSTVVIRQDRIFSLASYATPEHFWFQLPNLKFLPYPRTMLGILFSKALRFFLMRFFGDTLHFSAWINLLSPRYEVVLHEPD